MDGERHHRAPEWGSQQASASPSPPVLLLLHLHHTGIKFQPCFFEAIYYFDYFYITFKLTHVPPPSCQFITSLIELLIQWNCNHTQNTKLHLAKDCNPLILFFHIGFCFQITKNIFFLYFACVVLNLKFQEISILVKIKIYFKPVKRRKYLGVNGGGATRISKPLSKPLAVTLNRTRVQAYLFIRETAHL